MKKFLLPSILILLILSTITDAQVRRIVLLEEATNASCGPCAANNPKLQAFFEKNFGNIISVRYHASWPGSDPMYSHNTVDNTERIVNYYSVSGVPNYMIDGVNKGLPSNPDAMKAQMLERLAKTSPVKIEIDTEKTTDSLFTNIRIIAFNDVTETTLKLRTAIIERKITYASAPGNNGEKIFEDVLRKMLPNVDGSIVSTMTNGDTLFYSFSTEINAVWNKDEVAVVAWLQNDANKEVIQSNISVPIAVIESEDKLADILTLNQEITKNCVIVNTNSDTLFLSIKPTSVVKPEGWTVGLNLPTEGIVDSINVAVAPADSVKFSVVINTNDVAGSIGYNLFAKNKSDQHGYGSSFSYFGLVKDGDVLLVDADGGAAWEDKFVEVFDSLDLKLTIIKQSYVNSLETELQAMNFKAVFWNISWGFPAFVPQDITFLKNYLDNGGNVLLTGQDIGWDVFDASGSSTFQEAKDFYGIYLDATYVSDDASTTNVEGTAGNIFEGVSFSIPNVHGGNTYPEEIKSNSGVSKAALSYTGGSKVGGLTHDNGTYKTIYLGIGLEQAGTIDARVSIINSVLHYFTVITGVEDNSSETLPTEFSLKQNYPNPFNPSTTIEFNLIENNNVVLKVYDVLGKEVTTLVNNQLNAGSHSVSFDASKLVSGVYYYTIKTNDNFSVKKMMLLK